MAAAVSVNGNRRKLPNLSLILPLRGEVHQRCKDNTYIRMMFVSAFTFINKIASSVWVSIARLNKVLQ
jgi:hypothetical protein